MTHGAGAQVLKVHGAVVHPTGDLVVALLHLGEDGVHLLLLQPAVRLNPLSDRPALVVSERTTMSLSWTNRLHDDSHAVVRLPVLLFPLLAVVVPDGEEVGQAYPRNNLPST